jgi:hypothetical protein
MFKMGSFQKLHKQKNLWFFLYIPIYFNFRYTESEEKRMPDLMLTFIPCKNFDLLCSRLGAGAAGLHQNFRPELHKNDAALQH